MNTNRNAFLSFVFLIAFAAFAAGLDAHCDPVQVRHAQGTLHGYLAMHSEDGQVVAAGDLFQVVRGDRVTSHVVFHFKDGSLDDETSVFSQRGTFHLISDHHIQKGPFFSHPMDMTIDVASGQVTVRSAGKDGKDDVKTDHMNLPPDLANGIIIPVIENLPTNAPGGNKSDGRSQPETDVSMVVATPKPRLVKLAISRVGEDNFLLAGFERKDVHYQIKFELGGVAGKGAPLVGKQPPDVQVWIEGGAMPTLVREEGPLAEGSAIVSIQITGPELPGAGSPSRADSSQGN